MNTWYAWETAGKKVRKPKINFSGKWKNKLGSEVEFSVKGSKVTGKYRTAVGAPTPSEEFPLIGVVNGDIISFSVSWGKYGSVTSWVGQHTLDEKQKKESIATMWLLVKNIDETNEPQSLWGAFLTGANSFER